MSKKEDDIKYYKKNKWINRHDDFVECYFQFESYKECICKTQQKKK